MRGRGLTGWLEGPPASAHHLHQPSPASSPTSLQSGYDAKLRELFGSTLTLLASRSILLIASNNYHNVKQNQ